MQERQKSNVRNVLAAGAVVTAVAAGYVLRDTTLGAQAQNQGPVTAPVVQTPATKDAAAMQNAFAEVSRAVEPAVVTITTEREAPKPGAGRRPPGPFNAPGEGPEGEDSLEEFFKRFRGFEPNSMERASMRSHWHEIQSRGGGLGSGMIYRQDGLILTNAHVVRGADSVMVKLSDGREFKKAKVLGVDERTDVAVVKIPAQNLPVVKLGNSSDVRVGDWAIAVGNPFGLEHTLTVGVISAKAREVDLNPRTRGDYLQTDASINPGNSGGPLLDIYGRVIGINNAIYSESGGNIGIGFAIPINAAREIADTLVKEGKITRAYLGVGIDNMENNAAKFGLDPSIKGVLIVTVEGDTPGGRAGLQPGDVIVAFNGQTVTRSGELQRLVGSSRVGSNAELKILRGGKTQTLTAKLEQLPDETGKPKTPGEVKPRNNDGDAPTALGLRLRSLTPELAAEYRLKLGKGVVVVGQADDSPAAQAGVQKGDVIERVGQVAVSTPQEVQAAIKSILDRQVDDKGVALYINRKGDRRFVIVDVR